MKHIGIEDTTLPFLSVEQMLTESGFAITAKDLTRPWGGFFVIDEKQAMKFAKMFFRELASDKFDIGRKLSPKILFVKPDARLSWQYHHRRAEVWRLIAGSAAVVISDTDVETAPKNLNENEIIRLKQGERHRLVGRQSWGVVAEIWLHTDPTYPSDENDIIRVQDDFGR